jgi:hypothetical protein
VRKSILAVALMLGFSAISAQASINYAFTTAITYTAGSGVVDTSATCTANILGVSLNANYCIDFASSVAGLNYVVAYAPNAGTGVAGNPPIGTADNFGLMQVYCEIAGTSTVSTGCGTATLDGGVTVTVNQTLPVVATPAGTFVGVLGGSYVGFNNGAGTVDFSTTGFVAPGGVQYYLQQPTFPVVGYILNQPSTNNPTSLQGGVIDQSAPEPATLAMMGGGLAILAALRRRKA